MFPWLTLALLAPLGAGGVPADDSAREGAAAQQRFRAPIALLEDAFRTSGEARLEFWDGPLEAAREFYFTRAYYSDHGRDSFRRFASWSVDFPKADLQFLMGLKRLVNHLDAYDNENPIALTDPRLSRFPSSTRLRSVT